MRSFPALRLGAQVFFCVGVLSFFAPFCDDLPFFRLLAALVTVSSIAAVHCAHWLPRLALSLLPGLSFLLPMTAKFNFAVGAAILLYVCAVLTRGSFCPEYSRYRREAGWMLAISGVFLVISFFWGGGGMDSFRLLLCAVLLVLLALRMRQAAGSMGGLWQLGSVGMLGAALASGCVVGLILWALRGVFLWIFKLLAAGFALVFSCFVLVWEWLWYSLLSDVELESWDSGILPQIYFGNGTNPHPSSQGTTDAVIPTVDVQIPWLAILTVAVVLLLALAAVWFFRAGGFRRLRENRVLQASGTTSPEPRIRRKKSRAALDNRLQLRMIYSRYLDYLRLRGVDHNAAMTTRQISEASSELFVHGDELLRSLYRKARYSEEPVTDEELNEARTLLDELIAKENRKDSETA